MGVDSVQHNLRISVMFFNDLMIIIIEALSNDHASFELDDINERLKIVENQSIDDVFASSDVIDDEFQNDNEDQRETAFIIQRDIFDDILSVEFNHRYREK